MPLSYYTIDDMSLPRKGMLRKGWSVQHFDNLEEAIRFYREISLSKDKRLGLTDSIHTLELVRCVPIFSFDTEGEDILASDYRQYPLWADLPEAKSATQTCIKQFSLRYQFCSDAIMPLSRSNRLPKHLRDKYLWLSINHDPDSAIRWVYICRYGLGLLKGVETPRLQPSPGTQIPGRWAGRARRLLLSGDRALGVRSVGSPHPGAA